MWGHPDFRLDQWCLAHLAFLFIMCKVWGKNRNCNWLLKLIMVSLYSVLPFNLPSFSLLSCSGTVCNGHLFFWAGCWISGFLSCPCFLFQEAHSLLQEAGVAMGVPALCEKCMTSSGELSRSGNKCPHFPSRTLGPNTVVC